MQRIPDDSSIFSAEAKSVDLALNCIRTCDTNNFWLTLSIESYEPYQFKESKDSETFRKMSRAYSK